MTTSIFKTLESLGLTSKSSRVLYNNRTRDIDNLSVWKDLKSGVIYIDDFYTGDETYIHRSYENFKSSEEKNSDLKRRLNLSLDLINQKRVAEFGCGNGDFLKTIKPYCNDVVGIEIELNCVDDLNRYGIPCVNNLDLIENNSLDVILSYHVLEHILDPLKTLSNLMQKMVSSGHILIEVPHANDFLLSKINSEEFKQFTLWSQHLILHTRMSLQKILESAGFKDIQIKGVQRYPLSNHLNWIINKNPSGFKSPFSEMDTDTLLDAYESSLNKIDATDTLVAVARSP